MISKPLPKSIADHKYSFIWREAWARMHLKRQQFNACFCGAPGAGKTYSALTVAHLLDRGSDDIPRFSIDRVCFSAIEFADLTSQKLPIGSAIVLDDCGIFLYSKDALTKTVKEIEKTFQSVRHKRLCILLTLPSLGMLSNNVKTLLINYAEPIKVNYAKQLVVSKWHRMNSNPRSGKIYHQAISRKVVTGYLKNSPIFRRETLSPINFEKPPAELIEQYETRRESFMRERYKKTKKTLREIDNPQRKNKLKIDYARAKKLLPKFLNARGNISNERVAMVLNCTERRGKAVAKLLRDDLKQEEGAQ